MLLSVAHLLLTLGLLASVSAGTPPLPPSAIALHSCQLEDPLRITIVQADCGELNVPENPAQPTGRQVGLHVARIPAINRHKKSDPVFVLAGGPGQSATVLYAAEAFAFERIHRDRDIVLVDQRGTGQSNPLNCEIGDDDLYRVTDAGLSAAVRECLESLRPRADVSFYTTSVAVQDLDRVRAALGYELIDLYGVSYGTRVAQHYLRRFPKRTRVAILDGVVPPELILGPSVALEAERALTGIFTRCALDASCQARFGDPAVSYHRVLQSLGGHPVEVALTDPTSGQPARLEFGRYHLATVLRLASYSSEQAALLPLVLALASTSNNFVPLAAQFLLADHAVRDVLAYGMHNSVICSEDAPFYDRAGVTREALEGTYLGTTQIDALRNICSIWPHGPVDKDFHARLQTDVPVLLLSGSDDPATPPAYAQTARVGFTHSLHIVLTGFGHGQLTAPCIDRLMARFIDRGAVEGLDVACTRADKPMPFFTSAGGPAP